ncbi:hypothetical protein C7N43_02585 [Sphingobacteriales bacterium UPWRP_1]|nr:hypothetical protein B6N25_06085 [Sphingobacteriales bacterium TSM_CSS]PSJ78641.1 hypothetical protein C7N43_02585 [Sphingobacteriales bacterium UPWRP_1]
MTSIQFNGKIVRKKIGPGFWGIEEDGNGNKWFPVNLPEELQQDGLPVWVEGEEMPDFVSVFMWGSGFTITGYKILPNA